MARITKTIVLAAALMVSWSCQAKDALDSVQCGGDIPKALIGKKIQNDRVADMEKEHKDIGLKVEGSEDISDSLTYMALTICGHSYHVLESDDIVRDVLAVDHSRSRPAFLGSCELDGHRTSDTVFGILSVSASADVATHVSADDNTLVPVVSAWRVDQKEEKFIKMDTEQLKCPRNGISTVDGGP